MLPGGRAGQSPDTQKAPAEPRPMLSELLEAWECSRDPTSFERGGTDRRTGAKDGHEPRAKARVRARSPPPRPPNILCRRLGRGRSGVEATTQQGDQRLAIASLQAPFQQHPAKDGAFPKARMFVISSSERRGRRSLSGGSLLFGLRLSTKSRSRCDASLEGIAGTETRARRSPPRRPTWTW